MFPDEYIKAGLVALGIFIGYAIGYYFGATETKKTLCRYFDKKLGEIHERIR